MSKVLRSRDLMIVLVRLQFRVVAAWMVGVLLAWATSVPLFAQVKSYQPHYSGVLAPGAIGTAQLQRDGSLPGYFQPVEIEAPPGAEISLAIEGRFDQPLPAPLLVGLLIGPVYRFQVTGIPYHVGEEIFPTIELIHRLYPPLGQALRFPIVVQLTQEDLELVLKGNFVTRVIYVEDPDLALPARESADPIGFDTRPGEDPLALADTMGRPVAILRLGGRLPLVDSSGEYDLRADCAPLFKFPPRRDTSATNTIPTLPGSSVDAESLPEASFP